VIPKTTTMAARKKKRGGVGANRKMTKSNLPPKEEGKKKKRRLLRRDGVFRARVANCELVGDEWAQNPASLGGLNRQDQKSKSYEKKGMGGGGWSQDQGVSTHPPLEKLIGGPSLKRGKTWEGEKKRRGRGLAKELTDPKNQN